jgi:hypothetical protein
MVESMSIAELKLRLSDVPGIHDLTMVNIAGRDCYQFNGKLAAVDPSASDTEIADAIRKAAAMSETASPAPPQPKASPMSITGAKFAGFNLKSELAAVRDMMKANSDKMAAAIGEMKEAAAMHGQLAETVTEEARSLKADMAEFTNGGPTE